MLSLALLIALAVVIAPRVVDPNDYRQTIAELVKQQTGRDLTLEGDLEISVFPWLGIRTQGLALSQPPEIGDADGFMVQVQTAQLRIKFLPLLSRRVEIDTVVLEQPRVRIVTLTNGLSSFDGLASDSTPSGDPNAPDASHDKQAGTALALVIQGLQLTDGRLDLDDRQTGQRYQINDLNLLTGNLIGDELASMTASGLLIDSAAPQPLRFSLDGWARIDTDTYQITAKPMRAEITRGAQSAVIEFESMELNQNKNAGITARLQDISLSAKTVLRDADSALESVDLSAKVGSLNFDSASSELKIGNIAGDVLAILVDQPETARELRSKIVIPGLNYNIESGQMGASNIQLNGNVGERPMIVSMPRMFANINTQKANLGSTKLVSEDLSVNFSDLSVNQFLDAPVARGSLLVPDFNVAKLLSDLAIEFVPSNADALQSAALSTNFIAGLDQFQLDKIKLELDQSNLQGSLSLIKKQSAQPRITFDLALDSLNLDNYLPASEAPRSSSSEGVSGGEALAVPMAAFKDMFANGDFKAQRLISGGVELNDIDVRVASTPGKVTITPRAKLYEGKLGGSMVFEEQADKSQLRIQNSIDLVNLSKFLSAADVSDQLSGIGSLELDIIVTERAGVQSNSGTIKLLAKNGAIKGVDIKNIVDKGYRQYRQFKGDEADQQEQGTGDENDETRFAELLGTFNLNDFQISNRDFALKAPLFRVAGEGDIDLAQQQINYLVNVSIVNSSDGQGGEALDKLKGITLPIRFRGALTSPSYSLDLKALYKGLAKKEIEEKKSEYLAEKLGIEDAGKLSTKDLVRQLLIDKVTNKDREQDAESTTPEDPVDPPQERNTDEVSDGDAPDVYADPAAQAEQPQDQPQQTERSAEDQLKDELKNRILEGLFN